MKKSKIYPVLRQRIKNQNVDNRNFTAGYTLLETIVALAVILSALVGPVSLAIRGVYNLTFAKNKLIAVGLAQEGIELVRVIRENNQICLAKNSGWGDDHDWQTDFDGEEDSSILGPNLRIDATDIREYDCGGVTIRNPKRRGGCVSPKVRMDTNGNYGYLSGTETNFSRCVNIETPSGAESGPPPSPPITPSNMMDVISTVTWSEHGASKSVVLTERLYNWQ